MFCDTAAMMMTIAVCLSMIFEIEMMRAFQWRERSKAQPKACCASRRQRRGIEFWN